MKWVGFFCDHMSDLFPFYISLSSSLLLIFDSTSIFETLQYHICDVKEKSLMIKDWLVIFDVKLILSSYNLKIFMFCIENQEKEIVSN